MPVIKSYYQTTPITEEELQNAIRSCKDQENKVYQLFKKFVVMTSWDVYDVYNELIEPIMKTSVNRSLHNLEQLNIIQQIGSIKADTGRPVLLYKLINSTEESILKRLNPEIPKSIKLDIICENGKLNLEKMLDQMDYKLDLISKTFNIQIKDYGTN